MKTTKRKAKSPAKLATPSAPAVELPTIALASHCTVKDAAALKAQLCKLANDTADITLDIGAIERIDTATMQVLCAFARDRAARDQKVIWKGDSTSWREAVRLLGVAHLLGSERAAAGAAA
jgi:ABC-type transporter Mla MlaB component